MPDDLPIINSGFTYSPAALLHIFNVLVALAIPQTAVKLQAARHIKKNRLGFGQAIWAFRQLSLTYYL